MNPQQFEQFANQHYNRIPVYREFLADFETPLSTYLKLAKDDAHSYILESVQGGDKWGRYSFIGLSCKTRIQVNANQVEVITNGDVVESGEYADPLAFIDQFAARYRAPELPELPLFVGGLVGYFGYDTVRFVESRLGPNTKLDPIGNPDILLMLSEELVVFDNVSGRLFLIVHADPAEPEAYQQAVARLDQLETQFNEPLSNPPTRLCTDVNVPLKSEFESSFTQQGYEDAVDTIKEYIVAGDVMQVVPSQRMTVQFEHEPIDLYRALRFMNPSPYMFYLNLGDFHVVGASPEVLVRMEEGEITVRPIAGTRPRGATPEQDLAYEKELLEDPKELAEHLMLIDLGRNDVGRVSQTGSVELTDKMVIERYSHVMHIVSNVSGKMKPGATAMDALRATFPAGTLSGAPKIRALEIINELEPVKRGVYSGAVGYIGWNGNMDTAIAIRTAVIKDQRLHVQAGGGIVADSVPITEWEETLNKRRAMFRAVAMVEQS